MINSTFNFYNIVPWNLGTTYHMSPYVGTNQHPPAPFRPLSPWLLQGVFHWPSSAGRQWPLKGRWPRPSSWRMASNICRSSWYIWYGRRYKKAQPHRRTPFQQNLNHVWGSMEPGTPGTHKALFWSHASNGIQSPVDGTRYSSITIIVQEKHGKGWERFKRLLLK